MMFHFYITPAIDESGVFYEVERGCRGWRGKFKSHGMLSYHGGINIYEQYGHKFKERPEKFPSVGRAVDFINEHYGKQCIIETWRPK